MGFSLRWYNCGPRAMDQLAKPLFLLASSPGALADWRAWLFCRWQAGYPDGLRFAVALHVVWTVRIKDLETPSIYHLSSLAHMWLRLRDPGGRIPRPSR